MKIKKIFPSLSCLLIASLYCIPFAQQFPTSRDPLKWPFAKNSAWNMPIGSGAVYAPAGIKANPGTNFLPDEDIIVMKPKSPMTTMRGRSSWRFSRLIPI